MSEKIISFDSATGEQLWIGEAADANDVNNIVHKARTAFTEWSALSIENRTDRLLAFKKTLELKKELLTKVISQETGKPLWDASTEVAAMIGKIAISIEAYHERSFEKTKPIGENTSVVRHKPHGVVAVFGPYNFPGHLPNGHIVPALLAGNTVVFKPSELTPKVAETIFELWKESGLPDGVFNLAQGNAITGRLLALHPNINGLFFTGSWQTGKWLAEQFIHQPGKILALEMGGNNPLIVDEISDYAAASYITIQSAFLSSGQRCTCARRLIIPWGKAGDDFIDQLKEMMGKIKVGLYSEQPEPFMGPIINNRAAQKLLDAQEELILEGARSIVKLRSLTEKTTLLSPGLIDVTNIKNRKDSEFFGPLLQVIRVDDFRSAVDEANNTEYGLAAGLLSDNQEKYDYFHRKIKAGVVNWNTQLTGASSAAPFGGLGKSGNFRPSAYYAADYCSYPVSSMENNKILMAQKISPGIQL